MGHLHWLEHNYDSLSYIMIRSSSAGPGVSGASLHTTDYLSEVSLFSYMFIKPSLLEPYFQ